MQASQLTLTFVAGLFFSAFLVKAENGIWLENPADNNWNNPANWSSGTVPGGPDTATLGFSNVSSIGVSAFSGVLELDFSAGASAYTISFQSPDYFFFSPGAGVSNQSGLMQNLILRAPTGDDNNAGVVVFYSGSTAGVLTSYTCEASPTSIGSNAFPVLDFQGGLGVQRPSTISVLR